MSNQLQELSSTFCTVSCFNACSEIISFLYFQDEFVDNILNSGIQVNLSRVWLGEVYRLVTTYDILTKAGYKPDSPETNRSLISLLSGNLFTNSPARITDPEKSGFVLSSPDQENIPIAKKEGMKFARRLLLATWDSVLEVLGVPLDTSTKIIGNFPDSFI